MISVAERKFSQPFLPINLGTFGTASAEVRTETWLKPDTFQSFVHPSTSKSVSADPDEDFDFVFVVEEFGVTFPFYITDVDWALERNEIKLLLDHAGLFSVDAKLVGVWQERDDDEPLFNLESFNFELKEKLDTPLANFVTSNLWLMVGLASKVTIQIPMMEGYHFSLSYKTPLDQLKSIFAERQLAEKALIVESTFGVDLHFPKKHISADDVEALSFAFSAVTTDSFEWMAREITVFPPALAEFAWMVPDTPIPIPIHFPTQDVLKTIFGKQIDLKQFVIHIRKALIVNHSEAREHMNRRDGSPVKLVLRPVDGKLHYQRFSSPRCQLAEIGPRLGRLLRAGPDLEKRLAAKYTESFVAIYQGVDKSTLDGLLERPTRMEEE
ncbi:MAG TPA: hypothetical protein PLL77_09995 [Pyrinomonadaceae bacterium]|nr:hypothetical protein [Pyrinomonadaceae bacterium]